MKKYKYQISCSNCGKNGHQFKECKNPVTSYGIILISMYDKNQMSLLLDQRNNDFHKYNQGILLKKNEDILTFCNNKNNTRFLMIQRKHTLGYVEFIRGRYNIDDIDGIIILFKQMTQNEINRISTVETFEDLWNDVWMNKKSKTSPEFFISKKKFDELKNPTKESIGLHFYIQNIKPIWDQPEWGFPKGRRNNRENDFDCAQREFREETGIDVSEYSILRNIPPIEEKLIGTNGVYYKHVYYIGVLKQNFPKNITLDPNNQTQIEEIGNIGLYTFEEALKLIRPYHSDKKRILTQLYIYINNILSVNNDKPPLTPKKYFNINKNTFF